MKYDVRGTQLSPGADAHVVAKINQDRNETKLEIQSKNLTPPDRLLEGGTAYLVWVRKSSDNPWHRLGTLELVDEGRAGSAELTVSEASFDMLISAEKGPAVASPSGKSIFEQRIQEE
ncbi:MAG TPA: hypothetical protein VJV78_29125 [Polyangiales bacterium]|nr:hypothetical protein [Polyangiales bacterium]